VLTVLLPFFLLHFVFCYLPPDSSKKFLDNWKLVVDHHGKKGFKKSQPSLAGPGSSARPPAPLQPVTGKKHPQSFGKRHRGPRGCRRKRVPRKKRRALPKDWPQQAPLGAMHTVGPARKKMPDPPLAKSFTLYGSPAGWSAQAALQTAGHTPRAEAAN